MTRRQFPAAPTEPKALVLTAHPYKDGFIRALANAWSEGASDLDIATVDVHDLDFDPRLRGAYREDQPLEQDLVRLQQQMASAAHWLVAFPLWWSSTPAALKGAFDRVLLPGWAFRYENHRPVPGLVGRSARVMVTMDAPVWYDRLFNGAAGRRQVVRGTLGFSGLKPVRTQVFGGIGWSSAAQRTRMLQQAFESGRRDAMAVRRRLPIAPREPMPALARQR